MTSAKDLGLAVAAICAALFFSATAQAAVVTVSPTSMDSWAFFTTDSSGGIGSPSTATANMVNGPGLPPLPTGSAHFFVPNGDQSAQIRNSGWAGTRVDALTGLGYSTFATAWNGQQLPFLTIWLDTDGNGTRDDRLWFEPTYSSAGAGNGNLSPQPDPALNVWQTWNALNGMWYSDNTTCSPGSDACTLAEYLALAPNATIINDFTTPGSGIGGIGGIRLASGFASDAFDTNVDGFFIGTSAGTTTYNFELTAAAVPEPGSLALLGAALGAFGMSRRRKKK